MYKDSTSPYIWTFFTRRLYVCALTLAVLSKRLFFIIYKCRTHSLIITRLRVVNCARGHVFYYLESCLFSFIFSGKHKNRSGYPNKKQNHKYLQPTFHSSSFLAKSRQKQSHSLFLPNKSKDYLSGNPINQITNIYIVP